MKPFRYLSVMAIALFLLTACDPSSDEVKPKATQARKAPQARMMF